jgi:predicted phage terminase large subunit-like protein
VKGREEAESQVIRDRTWDWWENVALTRLSSNGICILMMTRWAEDDLAGRILARPSPLQWRILKIPAISHGRGDPLGRPEGEEMPSVRGRPPGYFTHRRATTTPYVWASIFDQSPTAAVGNFFRRASFRYWRTVTGQPDPAAVLARRSMVGAWIELEGRRVDLTDPGVWRFATCDVAASEKTSSDYTVVSVWCIDREGDLILLDRARAHIEMADHFAMARPLRDRWHYDVLYVEHSFYSKTLVVDARTAGIPVAEVQADTDKVTRAIPAAGRLHSGKCWFPAGAPWLDEWENELASFPRGNHDDQVDTFSYAARIAAAHWTPPKPPDRPPPASPELERIAAAYAASTGNGDHQVDIMNMPLG